MREIKFRAWDELTCQMYNVNTLSIIYEWVDIENELDYKDEVIFNDIDLMQYTGLKDRNGVEIYEGDIVKSTWNNELGIVEYGHSSEDDHAPNCTMIGFYIEPIGEELKVGLGMDANGEMPYTIIGNKYENPELLNKAS